MALETSATALFISSLDDIVIVSAVGWGIRGTPGVAARVFGALSHNTSGDDGAVNVIAIAQGSSECSISLAVDHADEAGAVRRIHSEVIVNGR